MGEKVIWCEELGKYGGLFIGENDSISYKHYGKKNVYKKNVYNG